METSNEVQVRALNRAAELLGGAVALAKEFGIPEPVLREWLGGDPVPPAMFLRAVDIITDHDMESLRAEATRKKSAAGRSG